MDQLSLTRWGVGLELAGTLVVSPELLRALVGARILEAASGGLIELSRILRLMRLRATFGPILSELRLAHKTLGNMIPGHQATSSKVEAGSVGESGTAGEGAAGARITDALFRTVATATMVVLLPLVWILTVFLGLAAYVTLKNLVKDAQRFFESAEDKTLRVGWRIALRALLPMLFIFGFGLVAASQALATQPFKLKYVRRAAVFIGGTAFVRGLVLQFVATWL